MTKKKVLISSGFVTVILLILNYIGTFRLCGGSSFDSCLDLIYDTELIFLPVVTLFIFSVITYNMDTIIFNKWWSILSKVTIVCMLGIFIAPSYSQDLIFPFEKNNVAFASIVISIFTSVFVIFFTTKNHQK